MLDELIHPIRPRIYTHIIRSYYTYILNTTLVHYAVGGRWIGSLPHRGRGYHKQSLPVSREADQQVSAQLAVFTVVSTLASTRLSTSFPRRGVCRLIGNRLLPVLSCQTRCPLTRKNNVRKIRKNPWPRRRTMAASPRQLRRTLSRSSGKVAENLYVSFHFSDRDRDRSHGLLQLLPWYGCTEDRAVRMDICVEGTASAQG